MKNEQRIWNKSELEAHPEWKFTEYFTEYDVWRYKNHFLVITEDMLGQTVQWCKDNGYTVTDEMIAKTGTKDSNTIHDCEMKTLNNGIYVPKGAKLVQEAITQANDKPKERLDKGEIGVTLENGTTLRVGERVTQLSWGKEQFIDITFIGKRFFVGLDSDGDENVYFIIEDWKPYTEPKEEQKPLEGYQKWYIHLDRNVVKIEYMTTEQAEDLKSKRHILGVYTEQEVIDLGLNLK